MRDFNLTGYIRNNKLLKESVGEEEDEYIDYFETPEKLPPAISDLVDKWAETAGYDKLDYPDAEAMKSEFEAMGWTFEYGLDGVPYGLRPMADTSAQGKNEKHYDWYTDDYENK